MSENLQKHTLNLRPGDWDYLDSVYRNHSGLATSVVIRTLVSNHVDELRARENPSDIQVTVEL